MTTAAATTPFAFDRDVTRAGAYTAMARTFADAGIDTPDLDARRLLSAALGIDAAALIMSPDRTLGLAAAAVTASANRRLLREPVSRILGQRAFYGRDFEISPATLDPRPDTETIVEVALRHVREGGDTGRPLRILDVGTGTGCLLVTLLAELPQATGVGTDISCDALAVAARNAARHGVATRATWRTCSTASTSTLTCWYPTRPTLRRASLPV
jgi:release factor glutamine methyltransferase